MQGLLDPVDRLTGIRGDHDDPQIDAAVLGLGFDAVARIDGPLRTIAADAQHRLAPVTLDRAKAAEIGARADQRPIGVGGAN